MKALTDLVFGEDFLVHTMYSHGRGNKHAHVSLSYKSTYPNYGHGGQTP
jgi:hypothetical protein